MIRRITNQINGQKFKLLNVRNEWLAAKMKERIWKSYLEKKTDKDYLSIYIDIPFCRHSCKYCYHNLNDTQLQTHIYNKQIDHLESELQAASRYFKDEEITALNFGGGSPGLLSADQLDRIFKMLNKYFNLKTGDKNEFGFECHPLNLKDDKIEVLRNSPVNRLSMGVQSFDKKVIKAEERAYVSPERVIEIIDKVRPFIKQINVDLLSGLFYQTPDIIEHDTRILLNAEVDWLTIYKASPVKWHDTHPQIQPEGHWELLGRLYSIKDEFKDYRYVGSDALSNLMKCNRFYKNDFHAFKYYYNPTPTGFNNIIGFSIDTTNGIQYPWSFFTPLNKGYERSQVGGIEFYKFEDRADRPHWKEVWKIRNA